MFYDIAFICFIILTTVLLYDDYKNSDNKDQLSKKLYADIKVKKYDNGNLWT